MGNTDIKLCEFEQFKQDHGIVHGIFTKSGQAGLTAFDFLKNGKNFQGKPGIMTDQGEDILKKIQSASLVFLNQVHGDRIAVLKKDDPDVSERFQPGTKAFRADGVITDIKEVFLVIQVADCQAVILYDPQKQVIANVHSGWRGSVKNIIGKCLDKMILEFGCDPESIMAGISPSLGPCCSEFVNYRDEIPKNLWAYKIMGRDYFDFWKISIDQLMEKGVKKDHIENVEICTKCHTNLFYSFRKDKTISRFACVISMT
jgi:hypothetical protein